VVYNHLGPEGNYLSRFGPYFTKIYHTPWGDAINYDGEWSDGVKQFFVNNILYLLEVYHIDGLRLDAVHTIFDSGAVTFWQLVYDSIAQLEQQLGRTMYLTAESDLNSPKVVRPPDIGGYGMYAQWLDDFHHALYVLLDPAGQDRYIDFGRMEQLAKAYTDGFVHSGEYVRFRKRTHGASSAGIPGDRFIIFNQNHDQVGNRVKGERLCALVDHERQKLAAAALMLAPYIPMLFMGEEYAADSAFFYFVSHSEKELIKAVQQGRKKEFENYNWGADPPDPQDEETFLKSKLQWRDRYKGHHNIILQWHKELICLRRSESILQNFNKNSVRAYPIGQKGLVLYRHSDDGRKTLLCLFNFSDEPVAYEIPPALDKLEKLLDSKEQRWMKDPSADAYHLPLQVKPGQLLYLPMTSVTVYNDLG
jgi:maltooligosyltrehalose trehalohydrolase